MLLPAIEPIANCPPPIDPEVGCADGEREGFLSLAKYPAIAGCSGGWSLPGITVALSPACTRSAGADSTNAVAVGGLAEVAFERARYSDAMDFARRAARLAPKTPKYLVLAGDAYFKLLRYDDALRSYEKARALAPPPAVETIDGETPVRRVPDASMYCTPSARAASPRPSVTLTRRKPGGSPAGSAGTRPVIVEEYGATTVVHPGQRIEADRFGNLILTRGAS